jgi:hypothetical protein
MAAINVVFFTSHSCPTIILHSPASTQNVSMHGALPTIPKLREAGYTGIFLFIMYTDRGNCDYSKRTKYLSCSHFLLRFKSVIYIPSRLIRFLPTN